MTEVLVGPPPAAGERLLFSDFAALDPASGVRGRIDLRVEDGKIVELAEGGALSAQDGERVFSGRDGLLLLPAFFDPHVHLRVPGQEHKEDLRSGTAAAAAGGFWAVLAMANTAPPVDGVELLEALRGRARREAVVKVGFFAAVSKGLEGKELVEMVGLRRAGAVGFSDDGKPVASARLLRDALLYQRLSGGVVALHEEDPDLAAGGGLREGPTSVALGLAGIPAASESGMVARDLEVAAAVGGRLHLLHLSTARSVALLEEAKGRGVAVSAEVTPHHLILDEGELTSLDTGFKVNPPLGDEGDRRALVKAFKEGTIDCLATDHAPHAAEEKEAPFELAPMGTIGLETAFAALYTHLVVPGLVDLERVVEGLCCGAALYGLQPATLAVGAEANLAVVDLKAQWVAGEGGWQSKGASCCFAGRRLVGRVVATLCAGHQVFDSREEGKR